MKKTALILIAVVLIGLIFGVYTQVRLPGDRSHSVSTVPSIEASIAVQSSQFSSLSRAKIKENSVFLEIANSEEERIKGLSGRQDLPRDTGLLFTFDEAGFPGIWMKDMNFSIDILWLDENFKVVDILEEASPASFPEVFIPKEKSKYVLEVNAGFVKEKKIVIGDKLVIF